MGGIRTAALQIVGKGPCLAILRVPTPNIEALITEIRS